LPISEYQAISTPEELRNQYKIGINALPQHIRANLDFPRVFWLDKISNAFKSHDTVVVRGASGQGKSSLAYRYLLDNYPESSIFCVEKLTSSEQAIALRSALSGIAKNNTVPVIVYMDVAPYDIHWVWLCEKMQSHSINMKLLITIREEDFRRSPIDKSKHHFSEIELTFCRDEAWELFQSHQNHEFLSFDDAWTSFGESGPLMEFIYMLNQAETLKARLTAQVNAIVQNDKDCADSWLEALMIISYAGKFNLRVSLANLFSTVRCNQQRRMMMTFENEYFLKTTDDGKIVESLHALRATLLYEILCIVSLTDELSILISTLKTIDSNALIMVISHIYENGIEDSFVDALATIPYKSWNLYAGCLRGLLWAEVHTFLVENKAIFDEGDKEVNNTFLRICVTDVTGLINVDMNDFWYILEQKNPGHKAKVDKVLDKLPSKKILYRYVKRFAEKTRTSLPLQKHLHPNELTLAGYSLFWLAKLGFEIPENEVEVSVPPNAIEESLDEYLNFLVGVQEQNWKSLYVSAYDQIKEQLIIKYNLVCFDDSSDEISAISIVDLLDEDIAVNLNHDFTMSIVMALRRLSSKKEKYKVKIVGQDVMDGITMPDMHKNIPTKKSALGLDYAIERHFSQPKRICSYASNLG